MEPPEFPGIVHSDYAVSLLAASPVGIETARFQHAKGLYPQSVQSAQRAVEAVLKAVIHAEDEEPPHEHDPSSFVFEVAQERLSCVEEHTDYIREVSDDLASWRDDSFYGSHRRTPVQIFKEQQSDWAIQSASRVLDILLPTLPMDKSHERSAIAAWQFASGKEWPYGEVPEYVAAGKVAGQDFGNLAAAHDRERDLAEKTARAAAYILRSPRRHKRVQDIASLDSIAQAGLNELKQRRIVQRTIVEPFALGATAPQAPGDTEPQH